MKAHKFIGRAMLLAMSLVPAGVALGSCSAASEYCDLLCDCIKCSDRSYDACIIQYNGLVAKASAYECDEDADKLAECYVDKFDCDKNSPSGTGCEDEQVDLSECQQKASKIGSSDSTDSGN